MTNLSSCMDSKSDSIRKGVDKLVALSHRTLPHPHSCLTRVRSLCLSTLPHPHSCLMHVRPLPQHPPSPSLVFNACEASLPQSPSHINLVGFLVAYCPSSLVFNMFEALHRPPSSPTIIAHLHLPPSSPTVVAHCRHPPSSPIFAHPRASYVTSAIPPNLSCKLTS